jgi:hypothetical protein
MDDDMSIKYVFEIHCKQESPNPISALQCTFRPPSLMTVVALRTTSNRNLLRSGMCRVTLGYSTITACDFREDATTPEINVQMGSRVF